MIRNTAFGACLLMGAALLYIPAAQAGFEFVTPPAAAVQAPVQPSSVGMVTAEPLPPENLLEATSVPRSAPPGKLVINPFPLEASAQHKNRPLTVEQAMLESGGLLRPVAAPGQRIADGMQARTSRAAREDAAAPVNIMPVQVVAAAASGSMTPLPNGEPETPTNEIRITPEPQTAYKSKPPAQKTAAVSPPSAPRAAASGADLSKPSAASSGQYHEAVGFGRDLPLALALSQIVPPEYSYAFEKDVNVGTTVSWQGGKPWNAVLDEMLATSGMRAIIEGSQVTIRKTI